MWDVELDARLYFIFICNINCNIMQNSFTHHEPRQLLKKYVKG